MKELKSNILYWLFLVHVMFYDRLTLDIKTGGRGVLPFMIFVTPAIVVPLIALPSLFRSFGFVLDRRFLFIWGPYLFMSLVFPVLGVLVMGYPPRTLLTTVEAMIPFVFISMGFWSAYQRANALRKFQTLLVWLIILESLFAFIQFINRSGVLELPFFEFLADWDQSSQITYSEEYVLSGRSVGTYINPNVLGFWAALTSWAALLFLRGLGRVVGFSLCLCTLALTESRGSIVAWLASVLIAVLVTSIPWAGNLRNPNAKSKATHFATMCLSVCGVVLFIIILGVCILCINGDRVHNGVLVLSEGASADQNFAGRVAAWQKSFEFYSQYPFGTFGSPEFLLENYIDNNFVRMLLQGGPLYLLSFILLLSGGGRGLGSTKTADYFLGISSLIIGVNSMTALPLSSPPIELYWLVLGYSLGGQDHD